MNRRTAWHLSLITLALTSAAQADEPGFYFGATASRVKHDVEGLAGIPIAFFGSTLPVFGGGPISPVFPAPIIIITPAPPYAELAQSVEINDIDAGFSATVGYRINRFVAAELTYNDFGEYERIERYSGLFSVRHEIRVSGPSLSVLGTLPLGEQWALFARGGVLFADQEVSFSISSRQKYDYSDEVLLAGAGVQWSFAKRWATRLEYQRTGDLQYDRTGESSIDQASLSVMFKL